MFEARKDGLAGRGIRGRWMSPLECQVFPKIGRRPISKIDRTAIRDTLKPIWRTKHPTAEKAIQKIRIILTEAAFMGYEVDPVEAEAAQRMLGVSRQVTPIVATPWQEAPEVYDRLDDGNTSALCLRLIMLTCVRASAARGARFDEIEGDVWTVPAERVKGTEGRVKDFRVPISSEAARVIEEARARADVTGSDLLFSGTAARPSQIALSSWRLTGSGLPAARTVSAAPSGCGPRTLTLAGGTCPKQFWATPSAERWSAAMPGRTCWKAPRGDGGLGAFPHGRGWRADITDRARLSAGHAPSHGLVVQ